MWRPFSILIVLVFLGFWALVGLRQASMSDSGNSEQGGGASSQHGGGASAAAQAQSAPVTVAGRGAGPATQVSPPGSGADESITDTTGTRYRRAYLLSLDGGALSVVQAQDIEGDFAPSSVGESAESFPGHIRCRLVAADGKVLAEEILPAPDLPCKVVDPRISAEKPLAFTAPASGPVLFQVRMARVPGASRLDIFRITGSSAPESLVGSTALVSR